MSCEPKRASAYSNDLRWRMVYEVEALNKSISEVAGNLCVHPSTIRRTVDLFNMTGTVNKRKYPPNLGTAVLTDIDKLIILEVISEQPDVYLQEIRDILAKETGTIVAVSTIWRFLHSSNITRQKMTLVAKQRNAFLRAALLQDMAIFEGHSDMLIFIDETGADRRNCLRRFGYSIRGKPPISHKLLVRGQRVNAIAAMSTSGILDCYSVTRSVDGTEFLHFIQHYLCPHLKPFDGINSHSVVVMDNASIHRVNSVAQLIESTGALLYYLPPYCPDLNPIEEAFSKLKATLRANEALLDTVLDCEMLVLNSFLAITPTDCTHWIEHAGYI